MRTSFEFALKHFGGINSAVEIGVMSGDNALDMLRNGVKKLILIDCYKAFVAISQLGGVPFSQEVMTQAREEMLQRIEPYGDRVLFYEMTSLEASKLVENNSIDYVYIDSVHTYAGVKQDIELWFPKVKKGGILAGHDYKTCHCAKRDHYDCGYTGLRRAVDEFANQNNLHLYKTSIGEEDWWVIK